MGWYLFDIYMFNILSLILFNVNNHVFFGIDCVFAVVNTPSNEIPTYPNTREYIVECHDYVNRWDSNRNISQLVDLDTTGSIRR